eukprot:1869619-Pleurochrysis_carterae.AAC.3
MATTASPKHAKRETISGTHGNVCLVIFDEAAAGCIHMVRAVVFGLLLLWVAATELQGGIANCCFYLSLAVDRSSLEEDALWRLQLDRAGADKSQLCPLSHC